MLSKLLYFRMLLVVLGFGLGNYCMLEGGRTYWAISAHSPHSLLQVTLVRNLSLSMDVREAGVVFISFVK